MADAALVESLADQFRRVFAMLRGSIEAFTVEQWKRGSVDFLIPCRQAYHAIESADFYSEGDRQAKYGGPHRFELDWEGRPAKKLPSREDVLGYLDEIEPQVQAWLVSLMDGGLLQPETQFPWAGKRVMDRALYLLRHVQHHLAQMNAELRRRGIERPKWQ